MTAKPPSCPGARCRHYFFGLWLLAAFIVTGCQTTSGPFLHLRVPAGAREDGSYVYLELLETPGSGSVARAMRSVDARHHDLLGDLSASEAEEVRRSGGSEAVPPLPSRFGRVLPLATLGPLQPDSRWPVTVPLSEGCGLAFELAKDRYRRPVFAFWLEGAHGRRVLLATSPARAGTPRRLAMLPGSRRALAEIAYDMPEHRTNVLIELDLASGVSRLLDEAALDHLRQGRLAEARATLERALTVAPDDATARYNLACVLARSGQADEAMRELATALKVDPHYLAGVARHDGDLDSLRGRPDFKALVGPVGEAAPP